MRRYTRRYIGTTAVLSTCERFLGPTFYYALHASFCHRQAGCLSCLTCVCCTHRLPVASSGSPAVNCSNPPQGWQHPRAAYCSQALYTISPAFQRTTCSYKYDPQIGIACARYAGDKVEALLCSLYEHSCRTSTLYARLLTKKSVIRRQWRFSEPNETTRN